MKETLMVAYLDPGTGSLVTQVLLGGAAGLAVAAKVGWRRLARRGAAVQSAAEPTDEALDRRT